MSRISELQFDVYDIINLIQAVDTTLDTAKEVIKEKPELERRLSNEISKFEGLSLRLNDEYKRLSNL